MILETASSRFALILSALSFAFGSSPVLAQEASTSDIRLEAGNEARIENCAIGVWVAPKFDYALQSGWGAVGGLLGQLAADQANRDKITSRKNDLEKALSPEIIYEILKSSDLSKILAGSKPVYLPLRKDENIKALAKSKNRNIKTEYDCYFEIYVKNISAQKTMIYGTFFDANFVIKKFDHENEAYSYSDSIRRKIANFPPANEGDIDSSYQGVRKVFSEQFAFFVGKIKK